MELNLRPDVPSTPIFTGGISIDNMTWWFWIKAGVGFSVGAALVAFVSMMVWMVLGPLIFLTWMGAFAR